MNSDYVLVTKVPVIKEAGLSERMVTWLKPFTWWLWGLIVLTIIVAGMVMVPSLLPSPHTALTDSLSD